MKAAAIEQEIDRLQTNQWAETLMYENCLVDHHPAHVLTTCDDRIAGPVWESELPAPILFDNFVIVQAEPGMYVLEYASTPEFYEAYRPLFYRAISSVRFHSDQKLPGLPQRGR